MVAKMLQRETEYNDLRGTEELFKWIGQMRTKKIKYLRTRNRNIRVEAVLGHALSHAEQQLRNKQYARIQRWQELNEKMASANNRDVDGTNNASANGNVNENGDDKNRDNDDSATDEHPELDDLEKFMAALGAIKTPLQR